MQVKASRSMDAICQTYGREAVDKAVADSPAGLAGLGSASCCQGCKHRLETLLKSAPEEAETDEAPTEAAQTAAGGTVEGQAADGAAEPNENDPLDSLSDDSKNLLRLEMELQRVTLKTTALQLVVEKYGKADAQRARRKEKRTVENVAAKAAAKRAGKGWPPRRQSSSRRSGAT
jgi:hypothetical protein